MLEWQFQKRLQESKQSDEDEEEEDDEDVDTMMIMQRLEAEKRARVRRGELVVAGKDRETGGQQMGGGKREIEMKNRQQLTTKQKRDESK